MRLNYDAHRDWNPRKPSLEGPHRNARERRALNQPKRYMTTQELVTALLTARAAILVVPN